jgi:Transcriptional regulator, AbiEi antitoxin
MVLMISVMTRTRDIPTALETFCQRGGVMKTSQALTQGIHPAALYRLVADGQLTRLARTLVDCFKYRNKLGLDVAIEALRFARDRKRISNREVLHFARLLRQDRVMSPYLESVT